MPSKLKKGYFVRGKFVAEGSELDLELKAELKGTTEASRTDLKRISTELQKLGEELLTLRSDLTDRLQLSDKLLEALAEVRRITNFEGRRRQMQYVGKLMRLLDPETLQAARDALQEQNKGSARETQALHLAEQWRENLVGDEDALSRWLLQFPDTDTQQLRALIRQARKDNPPDKVAEREGKAPRHSRAWRELFQLVREQLSSGNDSSETDE